MHINLVGQNIKSDVIFYFIDLFYSTQNLLVLLFLFYKLKNSQTFLEKHEKP